MKILQLFIIGTLLVFIKSDCATTSDPSKKNCNGATFSQTEKNSNAKYCCYLEYEGAKACAPYTQEEYDLIGKTKKGDIKGKIKCNSSYLQLGLLLVLSILFI